jgi:hypothetical protein
MGCSSLALVSTTADPALEDAVWDLEPLVESKGSAGVEELLNEARDRAAEFAQRHRGQVAELGAEGLADAMHELGAIFDLTGRAGSYAMLRFTLDTTDPARGALIQKARELGAAIETQLLFFDLEWNQLPDERAEELLAADGLDFCRHHLRNLRRYRPHQLSEPEERVMTELDVTGSRTPTASCASRPRGPRPRPCARACARARTCSTRCWPTRGPRTGCAPTRTGSRRATSPTRPATSPWLH